MRLLAAWLINAIALLALPYLLPSIHVAGFATTLGLFIFVINGVMFLLAAWLLEGFVVDGIWAGIFGSMVYSVISWALTRLLLSSPRS